MLGKLLKYEFKATSRFLGLIYLVVLVVAVVTGILGRISDLSLSPKNEIAFGIFAMIYAIMIVAMIIITLFLIVERFYKNMLQGEGYLMHTLPVPTWMHVASKTISAFVWEILAVVVLILSLLLVFTAGGAWKDLLEVFNSVKFWEAVTQNAVLEIVLAISIFVQLIRIVLMFYASMSIGASSTKHKIFFSILAFVIIVIIINVISMVANLGMITNMVISVENYSVHFGAGEFLTKVFVKQIIADAVYSVIFFLVTNFFLKRKLNLE